MKSQAAQAPSFRAPSLPLLPAEASPIGLALGMLTRHGVTTYFRYLDPIGCHRVDDIPARNRKMAEFASLRLATQQEIAASFGVTRMTVSSALRTLRETGEKGFAKTRKTRRRTALVEADRSRAERLLESGLSQRAAARELGVHYQTLHNYLRAGLVRAPHARRETAAPLSPGGGELPCEPDKAERNVRDNRAPMGRAARDVAGRVAASLGASTPREPRFEAARAVECGGVITALPALLQAGLLRHAARLRLPPGYYGVPSLLLLQSFMLLARLRNPEQLRYAQAGDWGALLGLDRCPEVKTLRAKVKALADDADTVRSWRDALTRDWLEQDPEAAATLCLDGHVQVYSGRQGRLKKHFVSRQKLCLPAAAGYWLNALDGQPFVCLHQDLDPGMVAAVRGEIVPHLRELGALPAVAEEGSEPAVTLVFDREGWSPKLFRELAREGVACVTWRKGKRGEDWPQNAFRELPVPVRGPGGERLRPVRLAEAPVDLLQDFQAREIRRLLDDGRQAALVTTHPSLDTARVAGAMLSRWSQENYFKYMRHEFNLDALPEHALVPVEDDAEIVNPERRAIDKQVRRLRGRMAQARNRLARERDAQSAKARETVDRIAAFEREIEELCTRRKSLPRRVLAGELAPQQRLEALPQPTRNLLDTLRMLAYRAETAMLAPVASAPGRKPEHARAALQALFRADANLRPDPARGTLGIELLRLADPAHDRAVQPLLDELNAQRTLYPGTSLRLVYEWLS